MAGVRRRIDYGEIIGSAGQFGAFTGVAGSAVGGTFGLFRSSKPGLFALVSGLQCFTMGATYSSVKQCAMLFQTRHTWMKIDDVSRSQRLSASAFGGCIAGLTTALVFRGPANLIPAAVVWSAVGFGGQSIANSLSEHSSDGTADAVPKSSMMERILSSRWSPMKKLSDEEYRDILREKLARVDADIALIDESLDHLRSGGSEGEDHG